MRNEARHEVAPRGERQRQGTVIMLVVVAMVAMFGVAALATDVGHVWAARSELQAAADAAALAGAAKLVDPALQVVTLAAANTEATSFGSQNDADQKSVQIPGGNLTPGQWNFTNRTLDTGVDLTNYTQVDALRVVARLGQDGNGAVQTVLARVVGRDFFNVSATATGYLGWVGTFPPGTSELPIAIDCCTISGGGGSCGDYCAYLASNKPNPFTLPADPTAVPTASCADMSANSCVTKLEFESTPEQNACYTDFGTDAQVAVPGLTDIVRDGNDQEFGRDGIQLDNGDKTPVVRLIKEKFLGVGEYSGQPAGESRYGTPPSANNPYGIDSWVVALPVVACQGGDNCAGSDPAPVKGGVCIEIRRVNAPPPTGPKEIYGRLFCPGPGEALDCGVPGADPGGVPGSLRVEHAVLVD